jgi:hypothetical protein
MPPSEPLECPKRRRIAEKSIEPDRKRVEKPERPRRMMEFGRQ